MVTAVVEKGVHLGRWIGRVAVRARGSFNIHTAGGVRQGVGWKSMRVLQRADGYRYSTTQTKKKDAASSPCLKAGVSAASGR